MYKNTVCFPSPAARIKNFCVLKDGRKILSFNDKERGGERLVVKEPRYSDVEAGFENPEIYWVIRNINKKELKELREAMEKGGIKCLDC
jgi:hypothetical protein